VAAHAALQTRRSRQQRCRGGAPAIELGVKQVTAQYQTVTALANTFVIIPIWRSQIVARRAADRRCGQTGSRRSPSRQSAGADATIESARAGEAGEVSPCRLEVKSLPARLRRRPTRYRLTSWAAGCDTGIGCSIRRSGHIAQISNIASSIASAGAAKLGNPGNRAQRLKASPREPRKLPQYMQVNRGPPKPGGIGRGLEFGKSLSTESNRLREELDVHGIFARLAGAISNDVIIREADDPLRRDVSISHAGPRLPDTAFRGYDNGMKPKYHSSIHSPRPNCRLSSVLARCKRSRWVFGQRPAGRLI